MLRGGVFCLFLLLLALQGRARADEAQTVAEGTQPSANERPGDTELLLVERAYWRGQRVGLAGPITLVAVSAGMMALGGWMFTQETRYKCIDCQPTQTFPGPSRAFIILGAAGFATGSTWLALRLVKRRKTTRELERIERLLGATSVYPNVLPGAVLSQARGIGLVGLHAVLRF